MKKSVDDLLTEANGERDKARTSLVVATGERDKAKAALVTAQARIGTLTGERDQLKLVLASAPTTIVNLTKERDNAKTNLTAALDNVAGLETLCGIHGVDPKNAISASAADRGAERLSEADWARKLGQAKTPEARAAICAEYEKAVKEKRVTD